MSSDSKLALGVSGGPDSIALLLLACAARPRQVEAATVDHGLREEGQLEAEIVARLCRELGVAHEILAAQWDEKPQSALQERARIERYRLLSLWAKVRRLPVLLTAHHADDQAETLLMRLNRGSGVRGLAGMRPVRTLSSDLKLVRPLLGWRRFELERICLDAGVEPVRDPSNENESFERVRVRKALIAAQWLDTQAVIRSASNLADADQALDWAAAIQWGSAVEVSDDVILYRPADAPPEIHRRIIARTIAMLASEGEADLRGTEIDRLIESLSSGGTSTIRGVLCSGGNAWRFRKAPKRRS